MIAAAAQRQEIITSHIDPIARNHQFPEEILMEGMVGTPRAVEHERQWRGFKPGAWCAGIDVRDFVVKNMTPYEGDEAFLAPSTDRTKAVWSKLQPYFTEERKKGVLAV